MVKMNIPLPTSQASALEKKLTELSGQKTSRHMDRLLKSAIVHVQGLAAQPDDKALAAGLKRSLEELEAGGVDLGSLLPGSRLAGLAGESDNILFAIIKQDGYCLKCGVFGCTNPDHKD
jgi:hypothetical protein